MQIKHILYYGYEEKNNKILYSYKKKEFQTAFQVGFTSKYKTAITYNETDTDSFSKIFFSVTTTTDRTEKFPQFKRNVMLRTSEETNDLLKDFNEGVEFSPGNLHAYRL